MQMKFMLKYLNCKHNAKVQPGEELRRHITFFLVRGRGRAGTDLFSVVISDRTQESSLKACQGRLMLDIRKWLLTQRVFGHWSSSPGQWSQHQPGRVQEVFGQCSQAQGDSWKWSHAGPGVGLNDPVVPSKSAYSVIQTQIRKWF